MKTLSYLVVFVFVFLILTGCKKEDAILPLYAIGFDGKTMIVAPSSKVSIKFNQRVTWTVSGGSAIQDSQDSLVYTAPASVGVYRMTVKNERDLGDSLVIKMVITPRASILKALQKGGYSLVFRHAAADVGADQFASTQPNWWKSCDANLARQLNGQGKKDAEAIGKALHVLEIPVGRVYTSEYCRCSTTADLMNLGVAPQPSKDLTYYVYDEANRYNNTLKLATEQPIDANNTVLVIHAGFSTMPSPAPMNGLGWGDAAIFQLVAGQTARYITTIKVNELTELSK